MKKVVVLLVLPLIMFTVSCSQNKNFEAVSAEYQKLESKYFDKIYALNQKRKQLKDDSEREKLNGEFYLISNQRQQDLEKFLKRFSQLPEKEEFLILKTKVLIELNRVLEAESVIARLKKIEKPRYLHRTKFEEIKIAAIKGDYKTGIRIFKEIEPLIEKDAHYYNILMLFAINAEEPQELLDFGRKFIEARDLPEEFWDYRAEVYAAMADALKNMGKADEAQGYLQKAISITADLQYKDILEKRLQQIKVLSNKCPSIASSFSLNGLPLSWAKVQNGITLIYFWAGWSESSLQLFYAINEVAKIYQARGVQVVGISKLFGKAFSSGQLKANLEQAEEVLLLRTLLRENNIVFPCFLDQDGNISKNFGIYILPTLVVIDKKGTVAEVHNGFFDRPKLESLLRKWLEEK